MDPDARAALERELQALTADFARKLPDRLAEIEEAWRLAECTGWKDEPFALLYRACHSLAGAGGTFGFDAVGAAARRLTDWLKHGHTAPRNADDVQGPALLAALAAAIAEVKHPGG